MANVREFAFQFPVRLALGMTINKRQMKSLEKAWNTFQSLSPQIGLSYSPHRIFVRHLQQFIYLL